MSVEEKNPRLEIKIASPEKILELSGGEVKKYGTYELKVTSKKNKLTEEVNHSYLYKSDAKGNRIPVKEGLFDPNIFKKYRECSKFKSLENRFVFEEKFSELCSNCERIKLCQSHECPGHIRLAAPVVHIWYFDVIAKILELKKSTFKEILRYEKNFEDIEELKNQYSDDNFESADDIKFYKEKIDKFKDESGAVLIRELLELFDNSYDKEISRIENNAQKQNKKLTTRLELINKIKKSGNKFSWMVLDVLPVVPPSIRPEIYIDGQIFEDDLFYLYRSVISRNNKILRYKNMHAPKVIIRNESRFLQQAVDALFDNDRCKEYQKKTISGRVYKGLTDKLKGKQGLFRQNLLGKRVDYSGRSVIVVGPELKLWQCGLPEDMAIELFRPHLIHALKLKSLIDDLYKNNLIDRNERVTYLKMLSNGKDNNLKTVYNFLQSVGGSEYQLPDFYKTLQTVVCKHPVILNRQPSLHRLSLQAFIPVLVEGKALKLHPLMCKGFGADFDGDSMSIHVPITYAAQIECWKLMLSSRNLLDPANGKTIIAPSQDMLLGIYYMTAIKLNAKGAGKYFSSIDEVRMAVEYGSLENQAFMFIHKDMLGREIRADEEIINSKYIKTSPGRLFFNEVLPKEIDFINKQLGEKELKELIEETLKTKDPQVTVKLHDALKDVGYKNATLYGASLSMEDIPSLSFNNKQQESFDELDRKKNELKEATKNILKIESSLRQWSCVTDEKITEERKKEIEDEEKKIEILNKSIVNSESQIKLIEESFVKRFLEQSKFNTVAMMINSGARGKPEHLSQIIAMKGFVQKAIQVGEQESTVLISHSFKKGLTPFDYFQSSSGTRKDLHNTKFSTADAGYLTRRLVNAVQDVVITESDCGAAVHSVLACKCKKGLCAKCYGTDLAINQPVRIGTPVGIIAAQSIGQVFSQLVLKSKHNYGAAGGNNSDTIKEVNDLFEARNKEKYNNNPELLVQEIKKIYEDVDEKHIALVVRKMIQEDGTILGITKVALNSESFMAASSFQLTEKGLKEAALFGKKDEFNGITENVIPGLKISAGTGMNGIDYFSEEAFK